MVHIREVPESNLVQDVDIPNSFDVPPDKCRNSKHASMRPSPRQLPFYFLIHFSWLESSTRPRSHRFKSFEITLRKNTLDTTL